MGGSLWTPKVTQRWASPHQFSNMLDGKTTACQMQRYLEISPTLTLDLLIDFGCRILTIGKKISVQMVPFPNTSRSGRQFTVYQGALYWLFFCFLLVKKTALGECSLGDWTTLYSIVLSHSFVNRCYTSDDRWCAENCSQNDHYSVGHQDWTANSKTLWIYN